MTLLEKEILRVIAAARTMSERKGEKHIYEYTPGEIMETFIPRFRGLFGRGLFGDELDKKE